MKKLFASLVLLCVLGPITASAQTFSSELQSAYSYAASIGITTMPTIEQANMHGNLIRSHMAKMMVNYAKNVLGKSPNLSLPCTFTDIANQSAELKWYIKEACQMGLMGQGISSFDPLGEVTRAQFGTVLSRALRGDLFDGATPYYKDHLQGLKEAGIMNKIDTPSAKEVRWWVMLMMMRVVQQWGNNDSLCTTKENELYCSLDMEQCPLECRTPTSTAGTLSIEKKTDTYTISDAVYLGSLQLNAANAAITLKGIKLSVPQNELPQQFRWEKDGVRITVPMYIATDNTVYLSPSNLTIPQWWSVVIHLVSTHNANGVRVLGTSNITSSASTVSANFPIVF